MHVTRELFRTHLPETAIRPLRPFQRNFNGILIGHTDGRNCVCNPYSKMVLDELLKMTLISLTSFGDGGGFGSTNMITSASAGLGVKIHRVGKMRATMCPKNASPVDF